MGNIIGGRSAVIQVTFLMEDRGFCKDVFATVEKPTRYYNRTFENYIGEVATWYSASPSIFESDCRISPQTIFEVVYQGRLCGQETETVTLRERSPLFRFLSLNGEKRSAALKSCQI